MQRACKRNQFEPLAFFMLSDACSKLALVVSPSLAGFTPPISTLVSALPLVSRRRRLLDRWISYRFLAERLRSEQVPRVRVETAADAAQVGAAADVHSGPVVSGAT